MQSRCHFLMLAVVEQAVADLQSPSPSLRWRARSWLLDEGSADRPFTFPYICRELGYDLVRARRRVFQGVPRTLPLAEIASGPARIRRPQPRQA